jgi:integrase
MNRTYLLFKLGHLWYYRLAGEKTFHTIGQRTRSKAEDFVIELIKSQETKGRPRHITFRKYAQPFFDWDRCPHIRRLREEGKSTTRRHAKIECQRFEKHILSDPFADKRLSKITRADVLDLRSRPLAKSSPATVNKALGIVKMIFREALFLEEINCDPTAGVGRIKEQKVERGIFTTEEPRELFPEYGYGPWRDVHDYTCFYIATLTGLRRGEILSLRWRYIDFDRQFLTVIKA